MNTFKLGRLLALFVLLLLLLSPGSATRLYQESFVTQVSAPYHLDLLSWELKNFFLKWGYLVDPFVDRPADLESEIQVVERYFSLNRQEEDVRRQIALLGKDQESYSGRLNSLKSELTRISLERRSLEPAVEYAIERQLAHLLRQQGISVPYLPSQMVFPPVKIRLETLPKILIVSPREKIEVSQTVLLRPGLDTGIAETIESEIEAGNLSAIIEPLGGFATYPAMVPGNASLEFALEVAAHEWLHNYFIFSPLGMNYEKSQDLRTMNETTANIAGKELGRELFRLYYSPLSTGSLAAPAPSKAAHFDFAAELRKIRQEVDRLLANGKVEESERYMEEKRLELAENGYHLRRLNQAYLAFHGSYADSPSATSPLGFQLMELRAKSSSLADFVHTVAQMSSTEDLERALLLKSTEKT